MHLRARLCAWSVRTAAGALRRLSRDRSHQISRLASGSPASAWLASRVCVCTYVIYLTPETTYVRALLASKIWRSATRYLACHSATCVDARARELKAFVHSTINA